ncbi:MAG: MmgE/PrpD family protein [Lautropia sp.]
MVVRIPDVAGAAADARGAGARGADAFATALAGFAHRLKPQAIPRSIIDRGSHLLLDAIGCGLAARRESFATRSVDAIAALAGGDLLGPDPGPGSTAGAAGLLPVVGFARRLPLRDAMLANGVLCHGLDYDDTHVAGVVHLTAAVAPAVLALASQRAASGADAIAAYVAGVEVGARIAALASGGFHAKGFHPTGVVGTFAAATACASLMGLDASGVLGAHGMALSFASGSLQFLDDGAWTKRFQPGWAAQAGLQAAHFAAHGIPAPAAPLGGRFGLYANYLGDATAPSPAALEAAARRVDDRDAPDDWELSNVAVKPFPLCHLVHASADAAIALRAGGVAHEAIERVDVLVPAPTMPVIGLPQPAKRRPRSDYEAKFSVHYAVASGLLRGRVGLAELAPAAYTDPAALALMDRIECIADPDADFPRYYGGAVRVTLVDGSRRSWREAVNRGHAERPLDDAAIHAKFIENACLHFSRAHADAIADAVLGLASSADLSRLDALLATDPCGAPAR